MKKIDWYTVIFACAVSWGLLWANLAPVTVVSAAVSAAPAGQPDVLTPNICPEGQYLDLTTNYCRNLHQNFGFDAAAFAEDFSKRTVSVDTCSHRALLDALDRIDSGGGLVQLPACTLDVDAPIALPDHLILQGAGRGETVLRATSGLAGENMLTVKEGSHVIVRDLTIDGANHAARGLLAWYADNILFERIEAMNAASSGIVFRYASRITIRYVDSHDNRENHGIGSKDCFGETLADCEAEAGDFSTGVLWSQDYAIYSNNLYNNGKYGLDSHASYGEIAGNQITDNGYGSKFPNASYLWIHHNRIADNEKWGTHLYSTLKIPERYPRNIVFYQNEFQGNGDNAFIASAPVSEVYWLRNVLRENASNLLRTSDVVVSVCDDGRGETPKTDGTEIETVGAARCNLASVAQLFGERLLGRAGGARGELLPEVAADVAAARAAAADSPTPDAATPDAATPDAATQEVSPTVAPSPTVDPSPTTENAPAPEAPTERPEVIPVPGRIEAEWYGAGGQGVGYSDSTLENSGDTYRNDDVDIQVTSDVHGAYHVGWIDTGEWLAYTIAVPRSGEYMITARLRTWESNPQALHVEIDGEAVIEPVEFVDTGEPWMDVPLGPVQLGAGKHELRVVMGSDKFNFNYLDVALESEADGDSDGDPTGDSVPTTVPTPTPASPAATERPEVIPVPGRIEAEWYRSGGAGVGYADSTLENSGETYRDDDVDIQETSDERGAYHVGWIDIGEWLAYTIEVQQTGEYTLTARLRTWESNPQALHVELDGEALTDPVEFVDTGEPWMDVSLGRVRLTKGTHELRVVMDSDKFNFNYLDVELSTPAPTRTQPWFWPFPLLRFQE